MSMSADEIELFWRGYDEDAALERIPAHAFTKTRPAWDWCRTCTQDLSACKCVGKSERASNWSDMELLHAGGRLAPDTVFENSKHPEETGKQE